MGPVLKKGLLLALVGLFLFCFMLGCSNSRTTKSAGYTTGAQSTTTMETTSTMGGEVREEPKAWGEETRENILKGTENP